jgi:hypothetical protein
MTRSHDFMRIGLSSVRWLLPWIAVLFASVTLAYAMSSALDIGASVSTQPEVGPAANRPSIVVTELSPAEARIFGMTRSTTSFGVISTTSPASTGHASSDGCCTWD